MAGESEGSSAGRYPDGASGGGAGPGALAAAMALGAASREKADAFLDKQSRIADLQIEDLEREDQVRHWSVRVHHISDVMKLVFEFAVGLVILLIVCGIGAMVWNAANDHDLVVDAFSVPPDIAQTGMTGQVLAGRVLDKFGAMQAGTFSTTQGAEAYRGTAKSVRVEIPETGISIGELNQYLREWLGDETHVTGDLVHTKKGYALTIRYGTKPGITLEGDDFGKLVTQSAEHIYAAARPLRYATYLISKKRYDEAEAILRPLTFRGSRRDRALAYSTWVPLLMRRGDPDGAMQKAKEAMRLDPKNPTVLTWLAMAEGRLGHEEISMEHLKADMGLWKGEEVSGMDPNYVAATPVFLRAIWADYHGDHLAAAAGFARLPSIYPRWTAYDGTAIATANAHDIAAARRLLAAIPPKRDDGTSSTVVPDVQRKIAEMTGDWPAALTAEKRYIASAKARGAGEATQKRQDWPTLALDMAKTGDVAGAEARIAKTPLDCDRCVRVRGRIAAIKHDWEGAAHWFAMVSARAPSIPFADYYWGEMLLQKGDLDGAIAKFESAHKKGAHFADPLEYWGEALIAKNRSDLALAKFKEANKYAPNWGRLHLKWGEALLWTGDKAGAQKQFAIAAGLWLTPAEKSQLAKVRHG